MLLKNNNATLFNNKCCIKCLLFIQIVLVSLLEAQNPKKTPAYIQYTLYFRHNGHHTCDHYAINVCMMIILIFGFTFQEDKLVILIQDKGCILVCHHNHYREVKLLNFHSFFKMQPFF